VTARSLLFALIAPLIATTLPAARASQYLLDQAHAIIPAPEGKRLRKAGIRSTLDLLTTGRTVDGRKALANRTGLPFERLSALVALADLMRVRGIGPDVARLLTAVGIRTVADLQRADPSAAGAAIQAVNREKKLSTNPPPIESISYWVAQSRYLPIVLE
jgi:hypothetical protein